MSKLDEMGPSTVHRCDDLLSKAVVGVRRRRYLRVHDHESGFDRVQPRAEVHQQLSVLRHEHVSPLAPPSLLISVQGGFGSLRTVDRILGELELEGSDGPQKRFSAL